MRLVHPVFILIAVVQAADPHAAVRDAIVAAMNHFDTAPAKLLALLDANATWCDPYPDNCIHGKANISSFLHSMPPSTNTVLLAEPLVSVGPVGGMMTTLSFSWPGSADSCLYTSDQHVSWRLGSTASATPDEPPALTYVRWVYNASEFDAAIVACLGPAVARHKSGVGDGGREYDLQVVKDYVVSLQYSLVAQARICDLLVPTARYCDPYPVRCAFGRAGCRKMKGLPPSAPPNREIATTTTGGDTGTSAEQCRPGSVRPLIPAGPMTGAFYMAYSSARRSGGKLEHTLHHTWAIWELAPPNSSHTSHVPMLASFDWFMPDHNV